MKYSIYEHNHVVFGPVLLFIARETEVGEVSYLSHEATWAPILLSVLQHETEQTAKNMNALQTMEFLAKNYDHFLCRFCKSV